MAISGHIFCGQLPSWRRDYGQTNLKPQEDSSSGHDIALKRIAEAKASHAEELDLGG